MKNKTSLFILLLLLPQFYFAQGTWTQKTDYPDVLGRIFMVSFSINGKGYAGTGSNGLPRFDFWEYDAVTDAWTQKADLPQRREVGVGIAILGKGYIGLGLDVFTSFLNDMWEYDPVLNTWTQKSSLPGVARRYAVAFEINNKAYIGLGSGTGVPNVLYADWWEYNPVTDTWTQKNNFPTGARSYSTSFSINGYGYVFGGDTLGKIYNDLWKYNVLTDAWSQQASMPDTPRTSSSAFSAGNMGYVFGGYTNPCTQDLWQYNPVSNAWLAKAPLPSHPRHRCTAFTVNGRGYVAGGEGNSTGLFSELWEYTPDSVFAGINEEPNFTGAGVYPNPFTTHIQLNLPDDISGYCTIKICDAKGKKIYADYLPTARVNPTLKTVTTNLPKGMYEILIASDNKQYHLANKIIKL